MIPEPRLDNRHGRAIASLPSTPDPGPVSGLLAAAPAVARRRSRQRGPWRGDWQHKSESTCADSSWLSLPSLEVHTPRQRSTPGLLDDGKKPVGQLRNPVVITMLDGFPRNQLCPDAERRRAGDNQLGR